MRIWSGEETVAVENISETLKRELPALLRDDPDLRHYILELTRREYAERATDGKPLRLHFGGIAPGP